MNIYLKKISKKYLNSQFCLNSTLNYKLNSNLNFKIIILLFTFIILNIFTDELKSQVIINEICPINFKSLLDDDHSNEDWIELYNTADTAVSLKGYRIFDKNEYDNAWVFPDTIMPPKSFLTIFASGKNRTQDDKFIMETSGEGMYYWVNPEGYSYAYTEVEGDFEAKVQITSFQNADYWANAGIMVREGLDNTGKFLALVAREPNVNPDVILKYRNEIGNRIDRHELLAGNHFKYPEMYLQLKRVDSKFIYSLTDISGHKLRNDTLTIDLNKKIFIGLSGNSKNKNKVSSIFFDNFILNNQKVDLSTLSFFEIFSGHNGKFFKNNTLHTNFKLNNDGEEIYLWDNSGNQIEYIVFPKVKFDISYVRDNKTNSLDNNFYLANSTPNQSNLDVFQNFTPNPKIIFDKNIFTNEINIKIENEENVIVKYTINGDDPIRNGKGLTENNITLYENTVLRIVGLKDNHLPSDIITNTFIKDYNSKLPIISLTIDNYDLNNKQNGLISSLFNNFEKIGNYEFIDKNRISNHLIGVQLHGGISRTFNQKSFRLYSRNELANQNFKDIFENRNYEIDRIVLRSGGQDHYSTKLRDAFSHKLLNNLNNLIDLEYKPVNLFFNGQYYGLITLRERYDDNLLKNRFNLNSDFINMMENHTLTYKGNGQFVDSIYNIFLLLDPKSYSFINDTKKIYNIEQFIDYVFFNTFISNFDWGFQNHKTWNYENGPLNFQPYDLDVSLQLYDFYHKTNFFNMFKSGIENNTHSQIFFKLTENDSLRNYFITRVYDKLNTSFKSEKMIEIFDKMVDEVKDDIPAHQARFPESVPNWHQAVDSIRFFLSERPSYYKLHLSEFFQIHYEFRKVNVKLDTGSISFNTIRLDKDFEGEYLINQKLTLKINLPFGLKLRHWLVNGEVYSNSEYIEIVLTDDVVIIPVLFDESNDKLPNIVINEIMHKSPDDNDSKDWIEIYNTEDVDVDLSNWQIFDDKETEEFTFPLEVKIKSKDYLVVTRNLVDFNAIYDKIGSVVNNKVGDLNFGLSANDQVRLFDNFKNLIDSVDYNITSPWPTNTFGEGWSLELISPELDNTQGENWLASYDFMGTPGRKNSIANGINKDEKSNSEDFGNLLYPNPNNGEFTIDLTKLSTQNINQIKIFDLNNRLVFENLISETINSTQNIKLVNLTQGVYTLQLLSDGYTKVITKFILE